MEKVLNELLLNAQNDINKANELSEIDEIRIRYLSRNSELTNIKKNLKNLTNEEKRIIGPLANKVSNTIEVELKTKHDQLYTRDLNKKLEEEYIEYLGNKVVCHTLPVRPGRNLAVIVESAAVNHRQKMMGYNAAKELYRRVQENLMRGGEDDDE